MNNKNEKQIEKKVTELSEISEKLAMADIQRIALAPSRQIQELVKTATRMTEVIQQAYEPIQIVASWQADYIKTIKSIQDSLGNSQIQSLQESVSRFTESYSFVATRLVKQLTAINSFTDLIIKLPTESISKYLSATTNIAVEITSIMPVGNKDYSLRGAVEDTREYRRFSLNTSANFELRVSSIEDRVTENNSLLKENNKEIQLLREEIAKRDYVIEDLLKQLKDNGESLVKIKNVKYLEQSTSIKIGSQKVSLRPNTYQELFARLLLSDKESQKKQWDIFEIQDAIGESLIKKDWGRIIYDTTRELNKKIKMVDNSVEEFFIATMKTVTVNPKYT